jgi:hypothetical protein
MLMSVTAIARHWAASFKNSDETDSTVAKAAFAAHSLARAVHSSAVIDRAAF